jgi:hypothetical protein
MKGEQLRNTVLPNTLATSGVRSYQKCVREERRDFDSARYSSTGNPLALVGKSAIVCLRPFKPQWDDLDRADPNATISDLPRKVSTSLSGE